MNESMKPAERVNAVLANPDEAQLREIRSHQWHGHNIALSHTEATISIDTHVAPDQAAAGFGTHAAQLSEPATLEYGSRVYDGRWFAEPEGGSEIDREWSAVSNRRSFWPSRRSLIRGVYHAGFQAIAELFGCFEIDREFGLRDQFSRLYLACTREW